MPTDSTSKKTFVLYLNHWIAIQILPNEKLGRLFRSIYEHEFSGAPIDLSDDPELNMAYAFMRLQIDYDREKWENKVKRRSNAGKKSGEVRRAKSEQQKLMSESLNKDEQNEHTLDLFSKSNKYEHNVIVDEYGNGNVEGNGDDVGDDETSSSTTITTSSSSYSFWDFYPVMFFQGFKSPIQVTKECVRYYEDQNWTLRGGRKLLTLDEKEKKARKWVPKDPSLKSPRTDMDFLAIWEIIWKKMKEENAPEHIIKSSLDERIKVDYDYPVAGTMTIQLPKDVADYIEANYLDILIRFRIEKGMNRIEYIFLKRASMAKYTL